MEAENEKYPDEVWLEHDGYEDFDSWTVYSTPPVESPDAGARYLKEPLAATNRDNMVVVDKDFLLELLALRDSQKGEPYEVVEGYVNQETVSGGERAFTFTTARLWPNDIPATLIIKEPEDD